MENCWYKDDEKDTVENIENIVKNIRKPYFIFKQLGKKKTYVCMI